MSYCIICGPSAKQKCRAPCSKCTKNFKTVMSEHWATPGPFWAQDPVWLQRLYLMELTLVPRVVVPCLEKVLSLFWAIYSLAILWFTSTSSLVTHLLSVHNLVSAPGYGNSFCKVTKWLSNCQVNFPILDVNHPISSWGCFNKISQAGWTENHFLQFWRLGSLSGFQHGPILVRALLIVYR